MATILVVDDRPTNRQFLLTLLGYADHRLLEAADGAQALQLVRAERPDLVITDILMPTMDGYEFVQRLRSEPALAATRVIFYTATYSATEAKSLARTCGVDAVLPKPCDPQEIFAAVNRSLGTDAPAPDTGAAFGATGASEVRELHKIGDKLSDYLGELGSVKETIEGLIGRGEQLSSERKRLKQLTQRFAENLVGLQGVTVRLTALEDLGAELMAERKPERIITTFLRAATRIIGSTHSAIGILDEREQELLFLLSRGFEAEILRDSGMDRARLPGSLLEARTPLRWTKTGATAPAFPDGHPPVRNFLGLRIATDARVYGWLYFAGKLGADDFSDEDERLAATMAAQLALLYDNASLYHLIQHHAAQLQIEVNERRRAQEALQESAAGLRQAQQVAKLAHAVSGPDGSFESRSETLPALIAMDPARLPKGTRDWLMLLHPEDRATFRGKSIEAGKNRMRVDMEYRLQRGDGAWIHIRHLMEPLQGDADAAGGTRWFNTVQDVTEQKRAEHRIRRLNRVYAVLSGINTLIVRVRDRKELFAEACRIAVDHGKFHIAWIGVLNQDLNRVEPAALYGGGPEFIETLRNRDWLEAGEDGNRPAIGRVMIEKKAIFSNDIRADARIRYTNEHMQQGTRSLAVMPLIVADSVVAVMCLHAAETGFFDGEEQRLLLELAGDISFALDNIEKAGRLDYLAFYDSLTGLANRTLFLERLNQYIRSAGPAGDKFAVVIADIERLRTVNESLGRQAGDAVIKELAGRLARGADPGELARIGADHFTVVLQSVKGPSEATRKLERLLQNALAEPFSVAGSELRIAARAGVAMFPRDGTDAETLLGNAEAALRKAKETGERDVFYTPELTERTGATLTLENKLRRALENDEFVLHYQPKVELETRRILGVEALIRWQSPELGLVPPMKFIPLMEETGMILDVGAWALKRASLDHRRWTEQQLKPPRVAVNVSAIQLRQRDFVGNVEQAIMEGVAPTGIDLEITESLIMEDIQGNIEKLKAVRGLGVSIAIDDFGTGYSSLGYLAKLPVQSLKIDRSFIITMLGDPDAMTLVQTIISLAHSLRLKVIAEGVDAEEQAKMLRLLRCDEMQGFLFSKPVPFDEMTALLEQEKKT